MAESFLGKIKKILEAPKPPPHILERQLHQVIIPWHVRFWRAIRLPDAVPDGREPMSLVQRRMLQFGTGALLILGTGYAIYSYISNADDRSRASYQAGMTLLGPGDYSGAALRFTDAIAIWSRNALAYLERGNAESNLGEDTKALADWTKAIEIDPKLAAAYTARGTYYRIRGDLGKALKDLDRSIELDPTVDGYYQRGQIYSNLGDHKKAIEDYDRAIAERRESPYVYLARANSRRALGDDEGFREDQKIATQLQRHH